MFHSLKKSFAVQGLLAFAMMFSTVAKADVIKCVFTEPFVDTVYSMAQQSLTISDFENHKKVLKHVSFQIKGAGHFELVDQRGHTLQILNLTGRGSDGMSDKVYPFEVTDTSMAKYANNGVGGCTSNFLKSSVEE